MGGSKTKKNKVKKSILGLYPRKALFFGLIFVVALVAWQIIRQNKFSADTTVGIQTPVATEKPDIRIEVTKSGNIIIDGKDSGQKVKQVDDYDELRLPVVDNPGNYMDKLVVELTVPAGTANLVTHQILAIHGVDSAFSTVKDPNTIDYTAYGVSGMATITAIAQFPAGVITHPFFSDVISSLGKVKFNSWILLALILPIVTVIFMFLFTAYQLRLNHVDMPDQEITAPPMAIPPAIVGVLFRQKVGAREVAATLIDLAKRKDIFILDRERGFAFGKGKFDGRLLGYEKILLSKIFKDNITAERKFIEERVASHLYSKKMSIVSVGIYAIATRLGYFRYNPRKVHAKYRLIGILAFLIGAGGFAFSFFFQILPAFTAFFWVGMMISALIIAFSAGRIPLRTEIGKDALSNWLAFRKFLTNPNPIAFSPDVYNTFEKYLPYAIVLECEAAWAKRFEPHNFTLPEWFLTDKEGLGVDEFCLALFPIVSYVGRSLAAAREPGFE